MLYRVMDKRELPALVRAFMESYEVVAPVKRGSGFIFDVIESPDDIEFGYTQTASSPKKYLMPPTETLMKFDARMNLVEDYAHEVTPRVIFGVHTCDINAMNRLDTALIGGKYVDPYYKAHRDATLVVGISCTPGSNCFCHLWGADEAQFGYDLFLHDIGDKYLVSMSNVEATNILEAACELSEATDEDRIAFRQATRARQSAFNKDIPDVQDVAMLMDVFHSDPFWEELGGKCLSCSACASVCPTCFCFDISDVLAPDGKTGERQRTWDACTSPNFAAVTGGHNFRPTGRERVRHRMYHKLNGFMVNHDRMLCVGCGRCVAACKTGINPIEVLRFFKRKGADHAK
jgi:ferredoxin